MDQEGCQLPGRQFIKDYCTFIYRTYDAATGAFDYTNASCPYTGTTYFDAQGNAMNIAMHDRCGKRLSDCKKRFGERNKLYFNGFPGIGSGF